MNEKQAFLELAAFAELLCEDNTYYNINKVRNAIKNGCKIFGIKYHQETDESISLEEN